MKTGKRKNVNSNINVVFVFILPVFLCLCFASCNTKYKETDPNVSFSKIYNKSDLSSYVAINITQTPDGGYMILAEVNNHPYFLRVSNKGDFLWDTDPEAFVDYIYPIPNLVSLNQENQGNHTYYFFCNKIVENDWIPFLLKFSEENKNRVDEVKEISYVNPYPEYMYSIIPSHASIINNDNYLLLSSNNWGEPVTFIGDGNSNISWKEKINDRTYWNGYNCSVPYPSLDSRFHYTGILKTKGKGYVQTFSQREKPEDEYLPYCFTIRMEAPAGNSTIHPEFHINRPFITMEWDDSQWDVSNWDGTNWSGLKLSGAYIDDNNFISLFVNYEIKMDGQTQPPQISLNENEYQGDPQSELLESKPVYIMTMNVNGQKTVFFAGSTRSDKIVLYAYEWSTRGYLDTRYFGHTRPFEPSGLIQTGDGGLVILGTTYVMDRFGRICLFKLSKTELEDMVR